MTEDDRGSNSVSPSGSGARSLRDDELNSLVPVGAETRPSRVEEHKVERVQHETTATALVEALHGSLRSYDDAYRIAETDSPQGSVLDSAGRYAALRHQLDKAVQDGDGEVVTRLATEAVHAGDQLALHVARNPTSRIRPAFDRRPGAGATGPTAAPADVRKIEQVGQARFTEKVPLAEATATDTGMLWDLQQRLFHARMDFLSYRVGEGLIAVGDIEVNVELQLRVRTAPDKLGTGGRDIRLPEGVETVHYYEQPEDKFGRGYARNGYGGQE